MGSHFHLTREDLHGLQLDIRHMQLVQSNHAERLAKIEKKQVDDAALKSVWNSPFPSVLGGTPQHGRRPSCPSSVAAPLTEYGAGPVQLPPPHEHENMFDDLDEHGEQLLGSLHLGPTEEEPVRRGAASRANSVRFDESALHGSSWSTARSSGDVGPVRSSGGGGMGGGGGGSGGLLMMERTFSHKSDGRHSSAGISVVHSLHSAASGRASSIGLDTTYASAAGGDDSPVDYIEPPPGFLVLGTVPAIVRVWLTTDFAPETLLYADACSGAQRSTVEHSLLRELGLLDAIRRDADGVLRASLPVYLTEAMPRPPTARTVIPNIVVDLEVVNAGAGAEAAETTGGHVVRRDIRLFLGSDALRAHSADILFSQNQMTIFSSEHAKFAVPFARPEDDAVYRHICTASMPAGKARLNANAAPFVSGETNPRTQTQTQTQSTTQPTTPLETEAPPQSKKFLGMDMMPPPATRAPNGHGGRELGLRPQDRHRASNGNVERDDEHDHDDRDRDHNYGRGVNRGHDQGHESGHSPSPARLAEPSSEAAPTPTLHHKYAKDRLADRRRERAVEWLENENEAHSPGTGAAPTPRSVGDASIAPSAGSSESRRESIPSTGTSTGTGAGAGTSSNSNTGPNTGPNTGTGIWGSWRHAGSGPAGEGGRESGSLSGYQPAGRSRNMRVLRPQKPGSVSSSSAKNGGASSYEPRPPLGTSSGGTLRRKSQASLAGDRSGRGYREERDRGDGDGRRETRDSKELRDGRVPKDARDSRDRRDARDARGRPERPGRPAMTDGRWESRRSFSMGGAETEAREPLGHGPPPHPPLPPPPRSANPIGGASAFSWMNGGNVKATTSAAASE